MNCDDDDDTDFAPPEGDSTVPHVPLNGNIQTLRDADIFPEGRESQAILLALLKSDSPIRDPAKLAKVNLDAIDITYPFLKRMLFSNVHHRFMTSALNKIFSRIRKLNLMDRMLSHYESMDSCNSRETIAPQIKINLAKTCYTPNVLEACPYVDSITLQQMNDALSSIDARCNDVYTVYVLFEFYSDDLDVGVLVNVGFSVSEVPDSVVGRHEEDEDDDAVYDFSDEDCVRRPAQIIVDSCESC